MSLFQVSIVLAHRFIKGRRESRPYPLETKSICQHLVRRQYRVYNLGCRRLANPVLGSRNNKSMIKYLEINWKDSQMHRYCW